MSQLTKTNLITNLLKSRFIGKTLKIKKTKQLQSLKFKYNVELRDLNISDSILPVERPISFSRPYVRCLNLNIKFQEIIYDQTKNLNLPSLSNNLINIKHLKLINNKSQITSTVYLNFLLRNLSKLNSFMFDATPLVLLCKIYKLGAIQSILWYDLKLINNPANF